MRKFRTKRSAIIAVVGVMALSAAAIAYWTQGGSGTGSGSAGTTTPITVLQTSTVSALYPGGPAQALSGTITNPNSGSVHVQSITASVTSITGAGTDPGQPACTTADFVIGGTSGPYVALADDSTTWSGLTLNIVDGAANQDNCKNATAVITYSANATS
jgi:hypothetical protein